MQAHADRDAMHSRWSALPWYPVLIAATYVVNLWVDAGVSVMAVLRSLGVASIGTALLIVLFGLVTRRIHVAGAAALMTFAILISRGLLYIAGVLVLAVAITLALLLWGRIRREPLTWLRFTRGMNVFSGLVLLIVLAGGITRGSFASIITDLRQGQPVLDEGSPKPASTPDIYVMLLDGYPRADSYERLFGADNTDFTVDLEDRGFEVADESQSNYMFTQLTLTSMLHMWPLAEIEELRPVIEGRQAANPLVRNLLNDNPVFGFLRDRGYRIVTSTPGYEHVALRQADVYLDDGQLNEFEYHLLRFTTVQSLVNAVQPQFFADQQRERIRSGFRHFEMATGDLSQPTFAFIHLATPHLPVFFDEQGGRSNLAPSQDIFRWDEIDEVTREAYVRQLDYLNGRVIDLIDVALAARPEGREPVIIVMSDHGAAPRPATFEGKGTPDHFANFFASLTPGAPGLFPESASPINVFPILFNHYFDMQFREWPDGRYPWITLQ